MRRPAIALTKRQKIREAGLCLICILPLFLLSSSCRSLPLEAAPQSADRGASSQELLSQEKGSYASQTLAPTPEQKLLPTLKSVVHVIQLSPGQTQMGYPVQLCGVVTYDDSDRNILYLQDSTAGIFVQLQGPTLQLKIGQRLEVSGITAVIDEAPAIINPRLTILGNHSAPALQRVSFERSAVRKQNGLWVEAEGVIHAIGLENDQALLTMVSGDSRFKVKIPYFKDRPLPMNLVDAKVRVKGVSRTIFNSRKQSTGFEILVQGMEQITLLKDAPADPFALPVRLIDSLMRVTEEDSNHRIKIQGIVTLVRPGRALFIQDETAGLYAWTEHTDQIQSGDRIEALGYLYTEDSFPALDDTVVRKISNAAPPVPVATTTKEILTGKYDSMLVQMQGRLLNHAILPNDQQLVVQSEEVSFPVQLQNVPGGEKLIALQDGSLITVVGVCAIRVDDKQVPKSFVIYPRSPEDIIVRQSPSWWTLSHLLWGLAGMTTLTLLIIGWVVVLQRRVRQQKRTIGLKLKNEVALEQRYKELFETASDMICTYDLQGNFTSINQAGVDLLGYRLEEILQMNISEILAPKHLEELSRRLARVAIGETIQAYEIEIIAKNERRYMLEVNEHIIYQQGNVAGTHCIKRDITERKQTEEELKKTRDVAIESARLKSEFLANMSHEIRTPMNGVIGMTGLLLETPLTDDQREFAETIRSSGDALLTIINDILDFSKIEAGKLQFETLDFDLNEAVEGSVELLSEQALEKRIEFASLIYSDVPRQLCGDPGRLRQVLINLIGNAIKFTEQGEVIVRATKESETDETVVIRFTVSDTGIGISQEIQRHLFQAFTQADGSTTRRYGGTGLGLAISKQLVELMGGEIGVTSEPGRGSTFWFTARFDKQAAAPAAAPPESANLKNLRALIVDDNATNRKILSHQFNSWGMIYEEAEGAARALEMLHQAAAQKEPYSLAVLDLMMPGMDGFALARAIKSDPKIAGVTLVLLTSYGQTEYGALAREAGVVAYLAKPVRQAQLFDCLTNAMGQKTTIQRSDDSPENETLKANGPGLPEGEKLSNKLILVAEDNIVNQKIAVRQLQRLGYRADAVANGREALEALGRIPYDLVLMDCQMPEMDGYEATAEIRRHEGATKHTLIVAMTAHALEGDRQKCIAAGMDDYISKPVRSTALGEILERLLADATENPKPTAQEAFLSR